MSDMPHHILDSGKVRCHMCGKLLRWLDAVETEIGYACEDHILQEDDEPARDERRRSLNITSSAGGLFDE